MIKERVKTVCVKDIKAIPSLCLTLSRLKPVVSRRGIVHIASPKFPDLRSELRLLALVCASRYGYISSDTF